MPVASNVNKNVESRLDCVSATTRSSAIKLSNVKNWGGGERKRRSRWGRERERRGVEKREGERDRERERLPPHYSTKATISHSFQPANSEPQTTPNPTLQILNPEPQRPPLHPYTPTPQISNLEPPKSNHQNSKPQTHNRWSAP